MLRAILISALALNFGLLMGRLSGFFREVLIAANFGVSFEADIVVLMLTVPDLMVSLLMGGAMGAVLVPEFSRVEARRRALLFQSMLVFGLAFCLVTALLNWQAPVLVSILVPGFDPEQIEQAADSLTIVLWLVPLTVLAGTTTAFLHARNKFVIASLGTLLVNGSIIAGLYLVLIGRIQIESIAYFVILGGLLRLASQLGKIRPCFHPLSGFQPFLLRRDIFVRYGQAMLSGSLLFIFPVVARAFASFESVGSVALLNFSMRLIELPMAICISFLSVVLFPRLSSSFQDNSVLHRRYVRYGLQATLALALVASIVLIALAPEFAGFVYGYGDMSAENVARVAALIAIGLMVLPLQGLAIYNTAIFNARRDTRTPMIINAAGLVIFLGLLKFQLLGTGLEAIMRALVASFASILLLQMLILRVEQLRFSEVYFDKAFIVGSLLGSGLCLWLASCIGDLHHHLLVKLTLGFALALLCLSVMALANSRIRSAVSARLGIKRD